MPTTLDELRRQAAEQAQRLLAIPFCPHTPSDKQGEFLLDFTLESMYGGAAGGGKSDGLLMGFLQFAHVPGYAGLILRRTYQDLNQPGALMDRAREWFDPTDAVWNEQRHTWRFPAGSVLQFGYLEHERHKFRYASAEFQYIGFDELTQFVESQYRFLASRLRRPKVKAIDPPDMVRRKLSLSKVPLRLRSATNPGGEGHEWVKRRFIDPGTAGMPTRSFHRATMYDNPFLDHAEYEQSLALLDPVTRAQLQAGDWGVSLRGNLFKREWFPTIEQAPPGHVVRYWDLAATEADPNKPGKDPDWTAGAKLIKTRNNQVVIADIVRFRREPAETEDIIRQTAEMDGRDVPVWIEQEPGSGGKITISNYSRNVLPQFEVHGRPTNKNKLAMAKPWSARASRGEVSLVRGSWLSDFFDEAEAFPSGGHDDMVDAVSGGYDVLFRHGQSEVQEPKGSRSAEAAKQPSMPITQRRIIRG